MFVEKTEDIILKPLELSAIKENIQLKLNKKIGTCDECCGYIKSIVNIKKYKTNILYRRSGNVIFKVTYTFEVIKPQCGDVHNCKVNIVSDMGLLVEFETIKVFIPLDTMQGWVREKKKLLNPETKQSIQKGDWIKVELEKIRFDNNVFKCIGILKH